MPDNGISQPVFIIGCGRSGTTTLGTALSKHREVTYLNEPRHLWSAAYPITDIWSEQASARNGKIFLSADDAETEKSRKLSRLFHLETIRSNRPVLIEKMPINNFRLQFIHAIFPGASFIHIRRNDLEVARSIKKRAENDGWFGSNNYKWKQLVKFAATSKETAFLPKLCTNYFYMSLLEWRLGTEAAGNFLKRLPKELLTS